MALNISNATYGRDTAGTKTLLNNLKGDVEKARKLLTNANYQDVIKNVEKYWSGSDAEAFKQKFAKAVENISSKMQAYEKGLEIVIEADAKSFANMQYKNQGLIK